MIKKVDPEQLASSPVSSFAPRKQRPLRASFAEQKATRCNHFVVSWRGLRDRTGADSLNHRPRLCLRTSSDPGYGTR